MAPQFRQVGVPDPGKTRTALLHLVRRAQRRTETLLNRRSLPRAAPLLVRLGAIQEYVRDANALVPTERLAWADTRLEQLCCDTTRDAAEGNRSNGAVTSGLVDVYRALTRILAEADKRRVAKSSGTETDQDLRRFFKAASARGWRVSAQRAKEEASPLVPDRDGFDRSVSFIDEVSVGADTLLPQTENFGLIRAPILLLRRAPEHVMYRWTQPPMDYTVYVVFGHYALIVDALFVGVNSRLLWVGDPKQISLDTAKFYDVVSFMAKGADLPRDGLIMAPRPIAGHHYCPVLSVAAEHLRYFTEWDIPRN